MARIAPTSLPEFELWQRAAEDLDPDENLALETLLARVREEGDDEVYIDTLSNIFLIYCTTGNRERIAWAIEQLETRHTSATRNEIR